MTAKFWIGGSGTWDNTNDANWSLTSGGANNTTHPTSADTVTFDGNSGAGAVVTVGATLNVSSMGLGVTGGNFTGTLNFNNNNATFGLFSFTGGGTRTLTLGNGTITLNGANGNIVDFTALTGLTMTANTATFVVNGAANNNNRGISTGGLNFNGTNFTFQSALGGNNEPAINWSGAATGVGTLTITGPCNAAFPAAGTLTVTNFVVNGSTSAPPLIATGTPNQTGRFTITATTATMDGGAFQNINLAGGAAGSTATNSFNLGGNNGFTITAPTGGGSGGSKLVIG